MDTAPNSLYRVEPQPPARILRRCCRLMPSSASDLAPELQPLRAQEQAIYRALARVLWLAVAIVLAFWFIDAISVVALLFAFTMILAVALNPPVVWMERHGVPRGLGTVLVAGTLLAVLGVLGWLAIPRLASCRHQRATAP